ncbi:MAG: PAS domain S-box protein, partial [Actinomycetota bacterium]|nr:PAS domain S-box protein [Actinomycetota bacterium]
MPSRSVGRYVAAVCALAVVSAAALAALDGYHGLGRPWLIAAFAGAIALEHLFETRLLRKPGQGESTTHEESFLVAMALLAPPLAVVIAFAAGFLAGNVVRRRSPLKLVFNVAAMVLAAATALLVVEALGGGQGASASAALAVVVGVTVFVLLNRALISGVLAAANAGSFRQNLTDDVGPRALVFSGNVSIGLLAGLAGAAHAWTLPFGLAAMVVLHFAFSGHVRARVEQQKLADVVESSSDGIVSVDARNRVRSWNSASERITGYAADSVLGLPLDAVSGLLDAERDRPDASPTADEDADEPRDFHIRTADGESRWVRVSRAPLPDGGSVLVIHDETARRQIEEMRAEQERERMRSDLLATVSHELRTPLTSILGFTQTLLARDADDRERRQFLGIIRTEAERLRDLIDDLLDIRVMSEGLLNIEPTRVDLRDVLSEQVAVFSGESGAHAVLLDVPDGGLWVRGERRRLGQVVANLLSNAIKYSPGGGEVQVLAT